MWPRFRSRPSWLLHSDSTASLVSVWSSGMPWTSRQLRRLYCSWAKLSPRKAVFAVSRSLTRCSSRRSPSVVWAVSITHDWYISSFTPDSTPLSVTFCASEVRKDGVFNSFLTMAWLTASMIVAMMSSSFFNRPETAARTSPF